VTRLLRILSTVLITAGLVVLADVGITLAWKEPVSSIYASVQQHKAENQLADLERSFPGPALLRRIQKVHGIRDKVADLARAFSHEVDRGQSIGRIQIPAIDLDAVIVQGTDTASLEKGPGHYPNTPFPGQGGTVAIAGHRTTYLAPFRHLDSLQAGDEVMVEMPYANFTYRLERPPTRIVDPGDVGIIHKVGYERLVMTACNPLYSAAQRIAGFARLQDVSFFASSGRPWQDP